MHTYRDHDLAQRLCTVHATSEACKAGSIIACRRRRDAGQASAPVGIGTDDTQAETGAARSIMAGRGNTFLCGLNGLLCPTYCLSCHQLRTKPGPYNSRHTNYADKAGRKSLHHLRSVARSSKLCQYGHCHDEGYYQWQAHNGCTGTGLHQYGSDGYGDRSCNHQGGNPTYITTFSRVTAFSMPGAWDITLKIQRPNQAPLQATFTVILSDS